MTKKMKSKGFKSEIVNLDVPSEKKVEEYPQTPIHPDNISEEDKALAASEPLSEERARLLKNNVLFHQEQCLEKIKALNAEIEQQKQDYWKMEGCKALLDTFLPEEFEDQSKISE